MTPICITPKCGLSSAPALRRGLCMICHSKAKRMVESGKLTWAQLEAVGLAVPVDGGEDPFGAAVDRLIKEVPDAAG